MERLRKADGGKLRALREDAWLSQHALAEKAGVSPPTVSAIEGGKRPFPHYDTIIKLAEALRVQPDALVEDREGDSPLAAARQKKVHSNLDVGRYRGAGWDREGNLGDGLEGNLSDEAV